MASEDESIIGRDRVLQFPALRAPGFQGGSQSGFGQAGRGAAMDLVKGAFTQKGENWIGHRHHAGEKIQIDEATSTRARSFVKSPDSGKEIARHKDSTLHPTRRLLRQMPR